MKLKKFISGAMAFVIVFTQLNTAVLPIYASDEITAPTSIENVGINTGDVVADEAIQNVDGVAGELDGTAPADEDKSLMQTILDLFLSVPETAEPVSEGEEGFDSYLNAVQLAKSAKEAFDKLTSEQQTEAKEQLGANYDRVIALSDIVIPSTEETQPEAKDQVAQIIKETRISNRIAMDESVKDYDLLGGVNVRFEAGNPEIVISVNDSGRVYGEAYVPHGITMVVKGWDAAEGEFNYKEAFKDADGSLIPMAIANASGGGAAQDTKTPAGTYSVKVNCGADTISYAGKTFKITSVPTGKVSVSRREITIRANDASKVYGASDPTFTHTVIKGVVVNGDQLFAGDSGEKLYRIHNSRETEKANLVGYPILCNLQNPNYDITYQEGGVLTISKATLNISGGFEDEDGNFISAHTREYGDEDLALKINVVGLQSGDSINNPANPNNIGTVSISNPATSTTTPGSVDILVNGLGNETDNYAIVYNKGSLNIKKRSVTIAVGEVGKNFGDPDPKIEYTISAPNAADKTAPDIAYDGKKLSKLNGDITRAAGEAAGVYDIINGFTQEKNPHYEITVNDTGFVIGKSPLKITVNDAEKFYGEANPKFTVKYEGFRNGETEENNSLTGKLELSTSATETSPVNEYDILASGYGAEGNYDIEYAKGTLNVVPRPITISADDKTSEYGKQLEVLTYTAACDLGTGKPAFVGEDSFTGSLTIVTEDGTAPTNVGSYPIDVTFSNPNYVVSVEKGEYAITPRPITVTIDDKTSVYGEDIKVLTYTTTYGTAGEDAFINSDDFTSGKLFIVTPTGDAPKNVGTYEINSSLANDNYKVTVVQGKYTIEKATLVITGGFKDEAGVFTETSSVEYGNEPKAFHFKAEGLKFNDVLNDEANLNNVGVVALSSAATATSIPNAYDVIASGLGEETTNYKVEYKNGTLNIVKRAISIKVEDSGKSYGDPEPTIKYETTAPNAKEVFAPENAYTGEALEKLVGDITRATGETVGKYPLINGYTNDANPYYDITFTGSDFVISQSLLKVTVDDQTKVYGETNPAFTVKYEGFKNGETEENNSLTGTLSIQTVAKELSPVSKYDIIASGYGSDGNYDIIYNKGTLDITPRPITIKIRNTLSEYGEKLEELSYKFTCGLGENKPAFVGPDKFTGKVYIVTDDGQDPVNVGVYPINASFDNGNYKMTVIEGKYSIETAPVIVRIKGASKLYGTETVIPELEFDGWKGDDGQTSQKVIAAILNRTPYLLPEITVIVSDDVLGIKGYAGSGENDEAIYEDAFQFEEMTEGNYNYSSASGDLKVSRLKVEDIMFNVEGTLKGNDVYGSNVTFRAAEGYSLSGSDALEKNAWNDVIYVSGDGSHDVKFFVKRNSDGAITTVGSKNFRIDTYVAPSVTVSPIHNPPTGINFFTSLSEYAFAFALLLCKLAVLAFMGFGVILFLRLSKIKLPNILSKKKTDAATQEMGYSQDNQPLEENSLE